MRRHIFCAALAAAVLSAAAVGTVTMAEAETTAPSSVELKTEYLYDQEEQEPYTTYGTGQIQTIALQAGDDDGELAALSSALEEAGSARRAELKGRFDEYCNDCREFLAEGNSEWKYEVSLSTKILPRRFDDKMFSFLEYYSDYSGGAHGYHCYTGYNFDPATGEKIKLADLVKEDSVLKGILIEELLAKYPEDTFGERALLEESISGYGFSEDAYELNWVGTADGLLFIFNPYDIAAYAAGVISVNIRFDKYPDLFTGDYASDEKAYVTGMMEWGGEEIDTAHDGNTAEISAWVSMDENGTGSSITVQKGEESCLAENLTAFEMMPLIVRTADGKSYLYLETLQENDWRNLEVFDITPDCPVYVGSIPASLPRYWDDEEQVSVTEIPANPDDMVLQSRIDVLSSYSGEKQYTIGEDGMAVPVEDYYTVANPMTIKTVRELPAQAVNPETHEAGEQISVPVGEELKICFTDGEGYADLMRADGSLVRVQFDKSEWPHTIAGEDESSYFEMLYYAG